MEGAALNQDRFLSLLKNVIGESEHLQNNPPELVPQESRVVNHVLEVLNPFSEEKGGVLKLDHVSYVEGRGNLIITYPGTGEGTLAFVGSHMDVVMANPDDWDFNPFELSRDGDKLQGRGVTDCLGRVCMIADLFAQLATEKPKLKNTIVAIFIANEENSKLQGIGVDELVRRGRMDHLKDGPIFWVDSADRQPCIGTAGMAPWSLSVTGKLFHSGLAHMAINSIELAMDALQEIQHRFYRDFPPHPKEAEYGFKCPSTMKPTQWSYPLGSINQIPGEATISGDIRLTPFYDIEEAAKAVEGYVDDINAKLKYLHTRGPVSKYELPEENLRGKIELKWEGEYMSGIACYTDTKGYKVMVQATEDVLGEAKPYSITGSLPLVKELQEAGFDIQITGFGCMAAYHARNEYGMLDGFEVGFKHLNRSIQLMEQE